MLKLDENPFTWDDTAAHVNTKVTGLKLISPSNSIIPVTGLHGNFKIQLPISTIGSRPVTDISLDKVDERETDLINHNVTYGSSTNAIRFLITPNKPRETYSLYMKLNSKATDTDFDEKAVLKTTNSYSYVLRLPEGDNGNGTCFFAIRQGE